MNKPFYSKAVLLGLTLYATSFLPLVAQVTSLSDLSQENLIASIDRMVASTSEHLALQKQLKQELETYTSSREAFMKDATNNPDLANHFFQNASNLYNVIGKGHFYPLLTKEFVDEITYFHQLSKKEGIARP